MSVGAKSRSVLVVAPIMAALLCLAVVGVLHPRFIDPGLPLPVLTGAVLVTGTLVTGLLVGASLRCVHRPCPAWAASALASALLTAFAVGVLDAWPGEVTWVGLRVATLAVVALGIALAQPTGRS